MAEEKTVALSDDRQQEDIKFEILEHIGVLRSNASGWSRELNIVSWNERPAKFDIREWTPDHEKMTKGITLTDFEMNKICELVMQRAASRVAGAAE